MKELEEKRNDLITRAETVLNAAKAEKRELTEDEAAELAEIRDNVRKIVATLQLDDDFRKLEPMEEKKESEVVESMSEEQRMKDVEKAEVAAFENFIRGYNVRNTDVNMTKADNGAVIPTTVVNYIIRKVYDICPILERSQRFNVKGKLEVPYYPADSNNITCDYQSEFVQLTSTSGKTAAVELTGFLAGCLTKISRSLVNNTQIDIVGFVVDEMAYAIKRFIERELIKGTSQKVTGLSTLTNKVIAASASAITLNEVIEVHDKVKDEFQQNAIWIMSPSTRTALRELKSNTGYPLLNDDISTPFGTSLLGKPVYVSDNVDNIGAGKDVIYYGDMRGLATKFSEDINIEVLRERFADEHAYGVVGWFEFDGKIVNEQMIAKLTMAGGSV